MKLKRIVSALCAAATLFVPFNAMTGSAAIEDHDPNGDGQLTVGDAVYISQFLCGKKDPADISQLDLNDNNIISELDSQLVIMYDAGNLNSVEPEIYSATVGADNLNHNMSLLESDLMVAATSTRHYNVYRANNGQHMSLMDYELTPPLNTDSIGDENSTENVIGIDTRYSDWSNDGTVMICAGGGFGTGFVVAPHVIATAAHCVINDTTNSLDKSLSINDIKIFSSDDNTHTPLSLTPKYIHIPTTYVNNIGNATGTDNDYALITVTENLSDYMTYNLGFAGDEVETNSTHVYVTGFPGSSSGGNNGGTAPYNMVTGEGNITNPDDNEYRLYYNVDATAGNSGGPAYIKETYGNITYNTVIAIHTNGFGYTDSNGNYVPTDNGGTRITRDLLMFYKGNTHISWQ